MVGKAKKNKQTSNAAAQAVATINKEIHDELNSTASVPARNKSSSPALDSATSHSHLPPQNSNAKDKITASPCYGGSWREKSSPVAAIARESICVSGGATTETPKKDALATKRPATYMNSRLKSSTKGVPIIAEPTKVNAKGTNDNNTNDDRPLDQPSYPTVNKDVADEKHDPLDTVDKNPQTQAQGTWFGWWSRPDGYANSHPDPHRISRPEGPPPGPTTPSSMPTELHPRSALSEPADEAQHTSPSTDRPSPRVDEQTRARDTPSRSWFGLWSASQNQEAQGQTAPTVPATVDRANAAPNEPSSSSVAADVTERSQTPTTTQRQQDTQQKKPDDIKHASTSLSGTPARQSTGWAFWSSDQGETAPKPADGPQKRTGELAVADTPSQSHPEAAQFNQNGRAKSVKQSSSTNTTNTLVQPPVDPPSDITAPIPPANTKERPKSEAARLAAATQALHAKLRGPPNHIFPAFSTTYPPAYNPSYLERIGQYLVSSLRIPNAVIATPNHVCLAPAAPKIKNAIAIGVHGYFPAAIIQKVLGQPTGTSIRFANYAADSIRWWTEQHQPDVTCEIDQIALEGEGLIADRVDTLWKLLLNWLSHLRKADLILVACHSQGVPVSVMLIAKLIELGCLGNNVKIGICAMAGVNLGPFIDFKSKFFGGSAAELFEFASPNSAVSREYASSLDVILRHGVRLTYVGSLDDQLVSLEVSSLASNHKGKYMLTSLVFSLHKPLASLCSAGSLHRRPPARAGFHFPPCRFCPQASKPRHLRPRSHPGTFHPTRRLDLRRGGPQPTVRRPGTVSPGPGVHAQHDRHRSQNIRQHFGRNDHGHGHARTATLERRDPVFDDGGKQDP